MNIEEIHFEAYGKVNRGFEDWWKDCDLVLVDLRAKLPIAGIVKSQRSIRTATSIHYLTPVTLSSGFEGSGPYLHYILFTQDAEARNLNWIYLMYRSPAFFLDHFVPRAPTLICKNRDTRREFMSVDGSPLCTAINAWRDSDVRRGVLQQFVLEDIQQPMAMEALMTAFAASCLDSLFWIR